VVIMKIWEGVPKVSGIYDSGKNVNKAEKTDGVTGKKRCGIHFKSGKRLSDGNESIERNTGHKKGQGGRIATKKLSPALTKSVKKTSQTRF